MNIGRESENVEFKRSTSELRAGIISISSILNKHGGGTLYFGVKDNGDVTGQQIGAETTRDISRDIRNYIKPECNFEVNVNSSIDGLNFIEVVFNGDRAPYSAEGKYYLRFSDQDRQMTNIELESYFRNKLKDYSEWENNNSGCSIDTIDEELIKLEVNKGYENNRMPSKFTSSKAILSKLGLLDKNSNNLNNAGNVLFSKEGPILLKVATFATETKETFLKLEHFNGNIYECINKAMNHILQTINWDIVLDGSIKRSEVPEIPMKALREIIVNSFCHAKYDSNTAFEVDVFKDRVCIYSPGFFPVGFTPEDFAYKHEEPIMLNPKIISVLFKTSEIESFGYGFDNTFKECKRNNVYYEYENTKSGFKFTFYRNHAKPNSLSETETEILNEIIKDNYIIAKDISLKINKSTKTIYRTLKSLEEKQYIKRITDGKYKYFEILKTN